MTKRTIYISISLFIVFLIVVAVDFKLSKESVQEPLITNFEECKNAGYPIMESYPEQCLDPNGNLFVRVIEPEVKSTEDIKDIPNPISNNKEFNKPITLKINDTVNFAGPNSINLSVYLKDINDSRCKPNVQCIWAGELSALFNIATMLSSTATEIYLGTVNNKTAVYGDYTISLVGATETTATVLVLVKSPSRIAGGYLTGHVDIGPICPVERPGEPCKVPPEVYTSREVVVYVSDKVTVKERVHLDAQGNYKMAIGPGNYFLQIVPAGIGEGEKKPVTVKSFETTTVNFDIDTGIR